MSLADTGNAIGAVSELLRAHLTAKIGKTVCVGRPEPTTGPPSPGERLNIFLYEGIFDASLKNTALIEGQPTPLWLVLKFLLTAFDTNDNSDSVRAHEILGLGLRALQKMNFMGLSAVTTDALKDNPEHLKITFDETPSDLLSRLMQGSDEKYRFSLGFQVRPVMIAAGEPTSSSLLVGIDYTQDPAAAEDYFIGEEGIHIPVIPSLGPTLTGLSPEMFEAGSTLKIFGNGLNARVLKVRISAAELSITRQKPTDLECKVNGAISGGKKLSAGCHAVSVVRIMPDGKERSTNLLVGYLLPTLKTAAHTAPFSHVTPAGVTPKVYGSIKMTGTLLGTKEDHIIITLYKRDGRFTKAFEGISSPAARKNLTFPPSKNQKSLTLKISNSQAIPPGKYFVILNVNGQQAKKSIEVNLT